jgi:hypothetical protein
MKGLPSGVAYTMSIGGAGFSVVERDGWYYPQDSNIVFCVAAPSQLLLLGSTPTAVARPDPAQPVAMLAFIPGCQPVAEKKGKTNPPFFAGKSYGDYPSHITTDVKSVAQDLLGYSVTTDRVVTKDDFLEELPKHLVWYWLGHSNVVGEDDIFKTVKAWRSHGWSDWERVPITPDDVAAKRGRREYTLVFLNACMSANRKDKASNAEAMADAFGAKAYVGWLTCPEPPMALQPALDFLRALDNQTTVSDAVREACAADPYFRKLSCLRGPDVVVDLTK